MILVRIENCFDIISGEVISESEGSEDDGDEEDENEEDTEAYMNEQKAKLEREKQAILNNQSMIAEVGLSDLGQ